MIVKALCVAALVAAPVPASTPQFVLFPLVELVECGDSGGPVFHANSRMISAAHVTDSVCSVVGVKLNHVREGDLDFSSEPSGIKGYKVNCEGFKSGETYY